jgi:hypothetical protein
MALTGSADDAGSNNGPSGTLFFAARKCAINKRR